MKKSTLYILFYVILIPSLSHGSGFRIPGQSVKAIGLAVAHIASTSGPDSSYYNPANMTTLDDAYQADISLTLLHLPSITYIDNRSSLFNGSSADKLFLLPQIHLTSKEHKGIRFGFSLTYPFGLSKSWSQVFPQMTAKEFSLSVIEANPTFSYSLSDVISLGGGLRLVYGAGDIQTRVENPPAAQLSPLSTVTSDLEGNAWELGYNLAISVYATKSITLAATYRSEVSLDLDGDALFEAWLGPNLISSYMGSGLLDIALPAVWSMAAAYSFKNCTLEIVWDRTFWSSFEELNLQFSDPLTGTPFEIFEEPIAKNWEDSDAFRLGLTIDWTETWQSTFGFAIDNTPVPKTTLGFDLPDADALLYSTGLFYHHTDTFQFGLAYMYHHTKSRSVYNEGNSPLPGIDGTFTDGGAHVVSLGMVYTF